MHPQIESRFEGIEARRKALTDRVWALPKELQNKKPTNGSFSPAEVIMHMALAEEGNVKFLRKNPPSSLKGKNPHTTFIFKGTVQKMANPSKPLATVGYMIPKTAVDLDAADQKWAGIRQETKGYLEEVETPDQPFIKFLFFFGLGSASDYLDLMEGHMTYHEQRFPAVN